MAQTNSSLLFLSQNTENSEFAKGLFNAESQKAELAWTATSGTFSDLPGVLGSTNLIIILQNTSEPLPVVPSNGAAEIEYWKFSAPSEVSKTIDQNLGKLVVRLIMKGGKRQPMAVQPQVLNNQTSAAKNAMVRVALESKGRGGKKVSVISGLPLNDSELDDLTTKLKRSCGTGGTFKDGQIEIQGDHRDKLMEELSKLGYKPKRKGG